VCVTEHILRAYHSSDMTHFEVAYSEGIPKTERNLGTFNDTGVTFFFTSFILIAFHAIFLVRT
jgi:hypothetical protein